MCLHFWWYHNYIWNVRFLVLMAASMKMTRIPGYCALQSHRSWLTCHPDDEGSKHFCSVSQLLPDYMVQYPGRLSSSYTWNLLRLALLVTTMYLGITVNSDVLGHLCLLLGMFGETRVVATVVCSQPRINDSFVMLSCFQLYRRRV